MIGMNEMKVCDDAHTYVWDQHIPLGAWYGLDGRGWWFCTVHRRSDDFGMVLYRPKTEWDEYGKILYRSNGKNWKKSLEYSETAKRIWEWAEKNSLWWTKCHWRWEEDRQAEREAAFERDFGKYVALMKHDRPRKKGGSGIRLDLENLRAGTTITDYECRKIPLNDFRRAFIP